jgi:translation elongation factor EF-1alpha
MSKTEKPHLNLIVIGHVDHGKSTTVGHLFYLTGTRRRSKKAGQRNLQIRLGSRQTERRTRTWTNH